MSKLSPEANVASGANRRTAGVVNDSWLMVDGWGRSEMVCGLQTVTGPATVEVPRFQVPKGKVQLVPS